MYLDLLKIVVQQPADAVRKANRGSVEDEGPSEFPLETGVARNLQAESSEVRGHPSDSRRGEVRLGGRFRPARRCCVTRARAVRRPGAQGAHRARGRGAIKKGNESKSGLARPIFQSKMWVD